MSTQGSRSINWERTRRNLLSAGGILAGAALSQLASKRANASASCFLRGTHILTPQGERRIEDLEIGDPVVTLTGDVKPIEWIGRRIYKRTSDRDWVESIRPVRIAAGALGVGVPHRELFLSQAHHLLIDGVLMRAIDILNGSSITLFSPAESEIEYLHIKLPMHDVIFAEGALSETLILDNDAIERFDNFVEYERLYGSKGSFGEVPCGPIAWSNGVSRGRFLSRMRSALSPWIDRRTAADRARDRLEEVADAQT